MVPTQACNILRRAREEQLEPAMVLSELLTVFFRERLQPEDPERVSVSACRTMLQQHKELCSLLDLAVREQNCQPLWDCGA